MGIIVSEEYTNVNGFLTPGLYVNIDNIEISKSGLETYNYDVKADKRVYISKEARINNKKPVENIRVFIAMDNVDNLHEQIYTEVKRCIKTTQMIYNFNQLRLFPKQTSYKLSPSL